MRRDLDASKAEVCRRFVSKLTSKQKQLDESFRKEEFLRNRLMASVDIPSIQMALRDEKPRTAQHPLIELLIVSLISRKRLVQTWYIMPILTSYRPLSRYSTPLDRDTTEQHGKGLSHMEVKDQVRSSGAVEDHDKLIPRNDEVRRECTE